MGHKQALTEADIAALAAGAPALAANAAAPVEPESAGTPPVVEPEAETAAAAAAEPAVEAAKVDTSALTIQLLNDQLKAANGELIQAHVKVAKLEEQANEAQAAVGPLLEIACKSANNMRIAFNSPAMDMSTYSAAQVLAEHAQLAEQFATKFKVGGIAAVSADQSKQAPQNPRQKALVAAAGFNRK